MDKLDWKHNVTPEEVDETLFSNPQHRKVKKGHRPGEDVYAALGQTDSGRYLIIFFRLQEHQRSVDFECARYGSQRA